MDTELEKNAQLHTWLKFLILERISIIVSNHPSGNYSESNASTITPKDQNTIKKGRFKVKRVASGAQEEGILK